MTGFEKRDLPHTSNLPTLKNHNIRLGKVLPSNLVNIVYIHRLIDRQNCKLVAFLITKLWVSKFIELDVCGRPLFANPVTNFNVIPRSRYSDRAVTLKKAAIVKISIVNPQISQ